MARSERCSCQRCGLRTYRQVTTAPSVPDARLAALASSSSACWLKSSRAPPDDIVLASSRSSRARFLSADATAKRSSESSIAMQPYYLLEITPTLTQPRVQSARPKKRGYDGSSRGKARRVTSGLSRQEMELHRSLGAPCKVNARAPAVVAADQCHVRCCTSSAGRCAGPHRAERSKRDEVSRA